MRLAVRVDACSALDENDYVDSAKLPENYMVNAKGSVVVGGGWAEDVCSCSVVVPDGGDQYGPSRDWRSGNERRRPLHLPRALVR